MTNWVFNTKCKAPTDFVVGVFNNYKKDICETLDINAADTILSCVDDFHMNTYFIQDKTGKPLYVLKAINPISWDNSLLMINRELEISRYAYHIFEDMHPRRCKLLKVDEVNKTGVIVYNYVGPAFTYEQDTDTLNYLSELIYKILYKLHAATISESCGFGSFTPMYEMSSPHSGDYSFRYLLRDIERDNLDAGLGIRDSIKNKWIPRLDETKHFVLTHSDVTLSNILLNRAKKSAQSITLIDWTYSIWQNPSYDIANMFFWQYKFCGLEKAVDTLVKTVSKYDSLNIEINEILPCFLARKLIDYGRFNDRRLVNAGAEILGLENLEDMIIYLKNNPVFTKTET
jgi:thiamine kinase-like enzyme